MEGNSHPSPRKPEGPKQDKPKVKHPKTHIKQINEDQTQRENVKSNKGKPTNNTQGIPIRITADVSTEILQARRDWQDVKGVKVVTYLGSLVQSCCGEGGILQTNITGMCGECSQCMDHTGFP